MLTPEQKLNALRWYMDYWVERRVDRERYLSDLREIVREGDWWTAMTLLPAPNPPLLFSHLLQILEEGQREMEDYKRQHRQLEFDYWRKEKERIHNDPYYFYLMYCHPPMTQYAVRSMKTYKSGIQYKAADQHTYNGMQVKPFMDDESASSFLPEWFIRHDLEVFATKHPFRPI